MAATPRATKQWCLTKTETVNSFENWRQNLVYTLSLDVQFPPFLVGGATRLKKTKGNSSHGFTDHGSSVTESRRRTAQQKVSMLELMLEQIANYSPVISRNTIVKNSTSIDSIWSAIRMHFGFEATGGRFLDFTDIQLQHGELPEDLYQRLMAFTEDNLLISPEGEVTPSLENFIVLTWLRLVHPDPPKLVKRYGTELRTRTLASIKPEISQALQSLLDEIRSTEDAKVMRTAASSFPRPSQPAKPTIRFRTRPKSFPLCKQGGRSGFNHYHSECTYLPDSDGRFIPKVRQIAGILDYAESDS